MRPPRRRRIRCRIAAPWWSTPRHAAGKGLLQTGTTLNYKTLFLQRLANPSHALQFGDQPLSDGRLAAGRSDRVQRHRLSTSRTGRTAGIRATQPSWMDQTWRRRRTASTAHLHALGLRTIRSAATRLTASGGRHDFDQNRSPLCQPAARRQRRDRGAPATASRLLQPLDPWIPDTCQQPGR